MFRHAWLFTNPRTVARQATLSMGLPRQEYWSGLPFPSPGDLPNPGIEPMSPVSPALASGFFTTDPRHLLLGNLRINLINVSKSLYKFFPHLSENWASYLGQKLQDIRLDNDYLAWHQRHRQQLLIKKMSKFCCCSVAQLCPSLCNSVDCQVSLSITISWSLIKLMSIKLVLPSNHLNLCRTQ